MSTPKITTFLTQYKPAYEKSEWDSNSIPHPEEENVLGLGFLVNLRFPSKQSFRVKSAFKSCDHISNSQTIKKVMTLEGLKVSFSCF